MGERSVGLARTMSKLGYCSRSKAFKLIRNGRVKLNGRVRQDPESPVKLGRDRVEVDGKEVCAGEKVYLMMNKPRGVVTTASDEKGRATVYDLLPEGTPWMGPVGRLDKASEGLLLLTNDSEWASRITDPESHVEKTYHVQIGVVADEGLLKKLRKGVESKGELLGAKGVEVLRRGQKNSWLEMVLEEGRNRQIRRMFEALEVEVLRLVRVGIGDLRLGDLEKGTTRVLKREEVKGKADYLGKKSSQ